MEQVTSRPGWILVVDDEDASRYALGRTLRHHGFVVREAACGLDALRLAQDGPDLVLLDVHLPDLSGIEVCRRLRSSERTSALPIVHMSASFTETRHRVQGLQNGADAYLTEPIDTGELLATIGAVMSVRQAERRARAAEEALRRTMEDLARSNEDLQQFAYAVSHDLKEPLRTVSTFAELLRRRLAAGDPDNAELLQFVIDGASRMSAMIDGILDVAQVGHRSLEIVPTNLQEVLEECLADLREAVGDAGAEVRLGPLPTLRVDRQQVRQLFQNLLGNALKFRRPDVACLVQVAAERRDDGWLLSVRDNGQGIPPAELDRVLRFFRRAHPDLPGLGLGLALARRVAERHGGRLWLESEVDRGTRACVLLPG